MSTPHKKYRKFIRFSLVLMLFVFGLTLNPIAQINFSFSTLSGTAGLTGTTSMQFGPDGKLYVGTETGVIYAYTVIQSGPTSFSVATTQTITLIQQIANHNDDGTVYTGSGNRRQVTGIFVTGTAANPVIYVSSSDPRIGGGGSAGDVNLDTNSGIISKLTWNGSTWEKLDLVRGLPRSEENHAVNGMQIDKTTGQMFLAIGGNTNGGAPSNNFAYLNETALSGAILKIDLNYINTLTVKGAGNNKYVYDIPTVNDPTRPDITNPDYIASVIGSPQTIDQGDPFGGNDGRNQGKLIPNGPVQIYSPGYRNPYDLVITKTPGKEGRMYAIDNGANVGWGGYPKNVNTANINNEYVAGEPGSTSSAGPGLPAVANLDNLHLVSKPGMTPIYAGQPNPIRANPAGAGLSWNENSVANFSLNPTADWPPLPLSMADAREANLLSPGVNDGALSTFATSTNGITEYTSSNYFGGQMAGDLLAADFAGIIWRMKLSEDGTQVVSKEIFASGFGEITLDVIAQGTGEIFEGTIWACDYTAGKIYVFTPQGSVNCTGNTSSYTLDDDEDGFSNGDERDNGTNPCNASSFPADFDGDSVSNLNDADDDNDGINDISDFFHRDPQNGLSSASTILYPLLNGNPGTGLYGLGLTGLMSNGTNPDALYQPNNDGFIMGGAVGLVSFPADNGIATSNTQKNGFQFGYKVTSASPSFSVQTSLIGPFFNNLTAAQLNANHRQGIYIGTGDQDNYLFVGISGETGGAAEGIRIVMENGGSVTKNTFFSIPGILGMSAVYLQLDVNPATGVVSVKYSTNVNTTPVTLGTSVTLTGTLLSTLQGPPAIAVGLMASSGTATTYSAKWDYVNILTTAPAVAHPIADMQTTINGGNQLFDLVNVFTDDEGNNNLTLSISGNTNPGLVSASINGTALTLTFVPQDTGTAYIKVKATDSDGLTVEDEFKVSVIMPPPTTSILINAGGSLETFGSETWLEDVYYSGGSAYTKVTPIDNTTKDAVYQSERWGDFSYAIPVPNGTYTVKLHFADFINSTTGKRKFNVVVEGGQGALNNYDIVAKAGGGSKAVVETMNNISVTDGILNMSFVSLVDYAKLSGIEIISVSGGGVNSPPVEFNSIPNQQVEQNTPSVTLSVAKLFSDNNGPSNLVLSVSGNSNTTLITSTSIINNFLKLKIAANRTGNSVIKIKATDAGGLFVESQFTVSVVASVPTPLTHIRINSGGPSISFEGKTWLKDTLFVAGTTYTNNLPIENTENDAMHHDERTENFAYAIPVPNGFYGVRIHFAELYWDHANARQLNVNVENNQGALTNYDIYVQAGGVYKAVVEQFNNIAVNDGIMNISFASVLDNAKVSGIEVFSLAGTVNTEPEVVNPIPTQNLYKNTPSKTISLATVFTDNNSAANLTYSVSGNSNTDLVTNAVITGTNLTLTIAPNMTGIAAMKVKATDAQGLDSEDEFQVNVQAQQTLTSFKMACGSTGFSFKGQTWSNDLYFDGGWLYSDTFVVVTNSENKKLYQYERDGNVIYHMPVIPGLYTVKLHFADLYWTQPGQRVFQMVAEGGKHVWNNYDIIQKAGGSKLAYIETLDSLDLSDGFFDLYFHQVIDNPKISGIEIIPYTNGLNVAPELLIPIPDQQMLVNSPVVKIPVNGTFSDDKGVNDLFRTISSNSNAALLSAEVTSDTLRITLKPNQTGTAVLKFRATDAQGLFVEDEFEVKVLLSAPPSTIRINAGGPAYTLGSDSWVADQNFVGGYTNTNTSEVTNSTIDEIYQSERWDNFFYNIPVINGTYSVKLHFSESYAIAPGSRKFNVNVENGQAGLNNYDILAKAGGINKSIVETFNNISVTDGVINITFVSVVGNAKVCGIEVLPYSASNTAPAISNAIPDQAIGYNTVSKNISLATVFNDNNGPANLTLTVTGNTNTAVITSATLNGTTLNLVFAANQSGTGKVKVRATDTQGLFIEDEFNVTVYPPGPIPTAPVINNVVADQTVNLGTVNKVISLVNVFSDDEGDANMVYSITGNSNPALVTNIVVSGTNVTLTLASGITGTTNIRVRSTDSDALFAEDEFKVDVVDVPETHIRIAAGAAGHTFGTEVWHADQYYSGGSEYGDAVPISGTTNDILYQNERWGNHSYNVPVPNGSYTVKLHFAEIFYSSANQRVFNINVENGQKTLNNYDIFVKGGNVAAKAVIETITGVNVTDGVLTISFTGVVDNAKVAGIEVISTGAVNTAPVVTTPIADQTVAGGTASKVVSLANVFTDNNGAANITLTVSGNTNTALVTGATITGTNLTLTFGTGVIGSSVVKVKATDAQGLFVEDQFNVTVTTGNTPPVVSTPIADQPVAAGTVSKVVSLANVFTDNGGAASLTLTVSGNSNVTLITAATISGTNLTLTFGAGKTGTSTVKIKATDALGLFVEDEFVVTVAANLKPVIAAAIPDQSVIIGPSTATVNFAGAFSDDNGVANLTYSITQILTPTAVTSATINGSVITLTLAPGVTGYSTIYVRATDAQGLYIEDNFRFTVKANARPVIANPTPDQTVSFGTVTKVISFANVFTDDRGPANITLSVTGNTKPTLVSSAVLNGTNLTLTFAAGKTGYSAIKVRGTDSDGLFLEDQFIITVEAAPVGTPTVSAPIPDQILNPGTLTKVISLASVFADDSGAANLILSVSGNSNTALVTGAAISGTNLTLTFAAGLTGSSTIKIKATDAGGLFIEDEFVATISATQLNTKPEVANVIPDQSIVVGPTSKVVNFSNAFTDNGGAANLTYSITQNSNVALVTSASLTGTNLTLSLAPGVINSSIIKLRATDAQGLYVEDAFFVRVLANARPVIANPTPDKTVGVGTTSLIVPMGAVFTDDRGPANITLTVTGNSKPTMVSSATLTGTNLHLSFVAGVLGTSVIKVRGTDSDGLYLEDAFNVTVVAAAPVAPNVTTPVPDQSVTLGTTTKVISLAGTFTDDEGAANITLSVSGNTNTALVTGASISGTNLTLTFAANLTGSALIKVKALDSDGLFVEDEFKADVVAGVPVTHIRIAAGGVGHTFGSEVWAADQYFTGGSGYGDALPIANTTHDVLYQNERWGNTTYSIPVPNGAYSVKLHFAEIYFSDPGSRIFNVNVENGQKTLTNYDIVAKAGAGATAVIETLTNVNVADGNMTITLTGVTDNAKISGIEVISNAQSSGNTRVAVNATIDVKANNDVVEVNWTSGDQVEGDYVIERSSDGKNFESLQTTSVSRNDRKNLVRRYADISPYNGTSYYRLKKVARNGMPASYSEQKQVVINKNNHSFLVYPNPNNSGVLFLEFPDVLGTQENLKLRVLNMQGAVMYQQSQPGRTGTMLRLVLPTNIVNGTYIVEIEKNGKRHHSRFILNR